MWCIWLRLPRRVFIFKQINTGFASPALIDDIKPLK